MATPCVLSPQEGVFSPWEISGQPPTRSTLTAPNTDANLRDALWDIANVAHDLPVEEALRAEIQKLCEATLIVDQAFHNIGRQLSDTSKEQNKSVDLYNTCHTLETQWNGHHATYKDLLWRSRKFAGAAQAAADEFRELVLPSLRDQTRTLSEKKEIIRLQLEVLQRLSQPSQDLCQGFLDFGKALDTYIAEFSKVVEGFAIDEQSKKIPGLEAKLQSAKDEMDRVSRELKNVGWKFATDVAVTGIALLLAFVVPVWWARAICGTVCAIKFMDVTQSGPQFFSTWRRFNSAVTEYNQIKDECELESACLNQMVKLESTLHNSRPLVQEVTIKLGLFTSVWAAITADIRKLQHSLEYAEDPMSPLFILRVQRLERMYGDFSQALRHYQVTVQLPQ